jgi:hypothetical protein
LNDEDKAKFKQELNAARKTEDTFFFGWTLIRKAEELTFIRMIQFHLDFIFV